MIEVIKQGKRIVYEFVCTQCDCKYIADLHDVDILLKGKDKVYHCYCPNCHWGNFGVMTTYGGDPK